MKKIIPVALLFIVAALMASCRQDPPESLARDLTACSWRVTGVLKDDRQEKKEFLGYTFIFMPGDKVAAKKGTDIYTGNWTINTNGISDDEPEETTLEIKFGDKELSGFRGEWMIIDIAGKGFSLSRMDFDRDSTNYLIFEKA